MKKAIFTFLGVLGLASILVQQPRAQAPANQTSAKGQADNDPLIAVDILLQPDQTMVAHANAVNATLRDNLPSGYSLDATHAPHITLLQRFIREKDLPTVTAALTKVFAANPPTTLQLKPHGIDYVMWSGVAVTVYVVEVTPDLMRLHEAVIKAVEPFSVSGGTGAAFVGTDINADTIGWVEDFIPKSSGPNYIPHVTLGIAKQDFANQLKAAPFTQFTFSPVGAAVYHLGNFGTAAKKLWQYQGK
jgi:2'-5' RNA ligase